MEFNLPAAILAIVFFASLRAIFHAIRSGWILKPPAYEPPPTSAPKPGESIQEYYARMERCGGSQGMDDAEFVERGYRQPYGKPFCTLRLNGSEQLEALQEKEGYGSRE